MMWLQPRPTSKRMKLTKMDNIMFTFPLFEEHDVVWTHHDLIMALKKHALSHLLPQFVKQKVRRV